MACDQTYATLTLKRGDTWRVPFYWFQTDGETPLDLTGCTARMDLKPRPRPHSAAALELTSEVGGGLEIDEAQGLVTMVVPAETTADLVPQQYFTDQQLTFPDGDVQSTSTLVICVQEDYTL